jgi:hypothetical protein
MGGRCLGLGTPNEEREKLPIYLFKITMTQNDSEKVCKMYIL